MFVGEAIKPYPRVILFQVKGIGHLESEEIPVEGQRRACIFDADAKMVEPADFEGAVVENTAHVVLLFAHGHLSLCVPMGAMAEDFTLI